MLFLVSVATEGTLTQYRFLIVAQKRTILSYSTSTSLLHRSLSLPSLQQEGSRAYIISYVLSPTDSNILYVAQSNGEISKLDWTTGVGVDKAWVTSLKKTTHMMIASLDAPEGKRDIIFTVGSIENKCQILVHELSELGESTTVKSKVIYSTPYPISNVQASSDGAVIVATAGARILVGSLRGQELVRYEFRIFESSDVLSSMDFRVSKRAPETGKKGPSRLDRYPVVDVVVGNVKGVIFLHDDLLGNLVRSETPSAEGPNPLSLAPRKHHWHRKAVLSVKWSLDGG
jgi:NET1-associated nuclear protein 1 (U3 small nucleolar RNA-associated protein 17)